MALFDIPTSVFLNCENKCSRISDNTKQPLHHFSHRFQSSQTSGEEALTGLSQTRQPSQRNCGGNSNQPLLCEVYSLTSEQTHTSFIYAVCERAGKKKMTHSFFSLPPVSRWAMSQNQVKSGRVTNRPAPQKQTRRASSVWLWKHTVM